MCYSIRYTLKLVFLMSGFFFLPSHCLSLRLSFIVYVWLLFLRIFFLLLLCFILFHSFPLNSISNVRIHLLLAFCSQINVIRLISRFSFDSHRFQLFATSVNIFLLHCSRFIVDRINIANVHTYT